MMKLSEMTLLEGETLVRDAEFESFGMVSCQGRRVFAPVGTPALLAEAAANRDVTAVACPGSLLDRVPDHLGVCLAEDPLSTVFRNHIIVAERGGYWPDTPSEIAADADIHPSAYISPTDVVIGARTKVGPLAVIERNSHIGEDCVIGPGVVIGGNGFEVRKVDGRQRTIPHGGGVSLGARVELQANTSVTRSLFWGATEIGDDSATDNLVHIAHNVKIGSRCRLAASAMIAGSTVLMDDVWIGPNATVSNGLVIGSAAQVSLGAVVIKDVEPGEKVTGHFAIEHRSFMRFFRTMRNSKS